ncbi:uncharacterized protein LOC115943742 [Leptonychotes weddellii]|uniref:Uncharacterized protein LOC115943742 n=1 Tax=Leptonychotes weddellii TaxID=9713 RepID=A0A7F8RJT3_LEPWE|nr:uncharacterized protein LOC115943742 [Leptonychotes weddellii]
MAAHGGSAASSALKGLIQQFTAITAPVLPSEEEATTASGLRVQAGDSPPAHPIPRSRSSRSVEGDTPTHPQCPHCHPRPGEWADLIRPRRPGDLGAGEVGGRTRATALLLLHYLLFSVQPWGAVHLTSFFHSSSARSFSPSPWPALPLSGPLRAIAVALACSGPPALTTRLVGSAVPLPILGDRPLERGVLRSTFKTEVLREE